MQSPKLSQVLPIEHGAPQAVPLGAYVEYVQEPLEQWSPVVHALPSLHTEPSGAVIDVQYPKDS